MTPDALQRLAAEHRRELLLEAQQERLAAPARSLRARRPASRLAASVGQLLAIRREFAPR